MLRFFLYFIAFWSTMASTSSLAIMALPPFHNSRADIEMILRDPELEKQMGQYHPILKIEHYLDNDKEGYWISSTQNCKLFVENITLPRPHARHRFKVNPLSCLNNH